MREEDKLETEKKKLAEKMMPNLPGDIIIIHIVASFVTEVMGDQGETSFLDRFSCWR